MSHLSNNKLSNVSRKGYCATMIKLLKDFTHGLARIKIDKVIGDSEKKNKAKYAHEITNKEKLKKMCITLNPIRCLCLAYQRWLRWPLHQDPPPLKFKNFTPQLVHHSLNGCTGLIYHDII